MNKSYTFLIVILIILALVVGGFALYRSTTMTPPSTPRPATLTPPPVVQPHPPKSDTDQISQNNTLPLTIISPQNNFQASSSALVVSGITAPNADVSVNDKDLKADAAGHFSSPLTLDPGDNYILVLASSPDGASELQLTVTYTPSQ